MDFFFNKCLWHDCHGAGQVRTHFEFRLKPSFFFCFQTGRKTSCQSLQLFWVRCCFCPAPIQNFALKLDTQTSTVPGVFSTEKCSAIASSSWAKSPGCCSDQSPTMTRETWQKGKQIRIFYFTHPQHNSAVWNMRNSRDSPDMFLPYHPPSPTVNFLHTTLTELWFSVFLLCMFVPYQVGSVQSQEEIWRVQKQPTPRSRHG